MVVTFRNMAACFLAKALILFGFVKRAKKKALRGEYILSLYFHAPGKKLFEQIVKWFQANGFHFMSVKDLSLVIKRKIDFPRSAVLLTFDDGWQSNIENVIPIVKHYRIPLTIFITTGAIENGCYWWSYSNLAREKNLIKQSKQQLKKMNDHERVKIINSLQHCFSPKRQAMTVDQVQKLALDNNITIGSHTVTHPVLVNCEDGKSEHEIAESKSTLEKWLAIDINTFAFPNGDYSQRELSELQSLGFELAFTTKEQYLTLQRLKNPLEIPRFYINERASLSENICRMMGVWPGKNLFSFLRR